eukprot:1888356-Rhodomonas_salina.6
MGDVQTSLRECLDDRFGKGLITFCVHLSCWAGAAVVPACLWRGSTVNVHTLPGETVVARALVLEAWVLHRIGHPVPKGRGAIIRRNLDTVQGVLCNVACHPRVLIRIAEQALRADAVGAVGAVAALRLLGAIRDVQAVARPLFRVLGQLRAVGHSPRHAVEVERRTLGESAFRVTPGAVRTGGGLTDIDITHTRPFPKASVHQTLCPDQVVEIQEQQAPLPRPSVLGVPRQLVAEHAGLDRLRYHLQRHLVVVHPALRHSRPIRQLRVQKRIRVAPCRVGVVWTGRPPKSEIVDASCGEMRRLRGHGFASETAHRQCSPRKKPNSDAATLGPGPAKKSCVKPDCTTRSSSMLRSWNEVPASGCATTTPQAGQRRSAFGMRAAGRGRGG